MRTKMFLFFLILSLVANSGASSTYKFCNDPDKAEHKGRNADCKDDEIADTDYTWTADNFFNSRKPVCTAGKGPELLTEVDMNRGLYIEGNTNDDIDLILRPINTGCRKVLVRIDDQYDIQDYQDPNVSPSASVKKGKKTLIAVFEPACRLIVKVEDPSKVARIDHVFMKNIKAEIFTKQIEAAEDKTLGNFIFSNQNIKDKMNDYNVPFQTKEVNRFFKFPEEIMNDNRKINCNYKCKYGKIFKYKLGRGVPFANKFHISQDCEWMTVHISNEKDNIVPDHMVFAAEISLRHGFVTLPKEVKAFPMDFDIFTLKENDDRKIVAEQNGYEVSLGYYRDKSEKTSHMVITNSHGRAVRTQQLMGSSQEITFAFSDDTCLVKPIGAEIQTTDKKFNGYEFHEKYNLAFLVARVDGYDGEGYAQKKDDDPLKDKYEEKTLTFEDEKKRTKDAADQEMGGESIDKNNEGVEVSTPKPMSDNAPDVEPGITPNFISEEELAKINNNNNQEEKKREAIRKKLKNPGYAYWAIPAGFATGSFGSFIICNIIMFIFKRSVLTFWYKAMYKRYGSDTTMGAGTTMGKTMGGETIGGSTTVGGGTTAGGTTAGGETTGSTTAA